jgi:hypothetical protein
VMLSPGGDVKVMDFGIAAAADETSSTTGSGLYATVAYVSPERVAGQPATPASDVYSLGAVLYELLSGRPPFTGPSAALVARAHLHDQPRPVTELAPWVPADLAEACRVAREKDPARRPSSAAAFAARLRAAAARAALHGGPTERLAGARPQRTKREPGQEPPEGSAATVQVGAGRPVWRRRRRRVTALLGVTLAALLAVVAARELSGGGAGRDDPPPATATATATATVTVALRATAEVWARVAVDGRVAYEGTLAAGDRRAFTAHRAIDLHLGNAGGAQLTVDGRSRGAPGRPGQVWRGHFTPRPRPDG